MNVIDSNAYIIKQIQSNTPFIISRLGEPESYITYMYIQQHSIPYLSQMVQTLSNNAGIYANNKKELQSYCKHYNKALKNSCALACFENIRNHVQQLQEYFTVTYTLHNIHSRSIEPFYVCKDDVVPWTQHLLGKKVLLINPFVESFKQQLENKFQIFTHMPLFKEGQEFVFYKSFNTSASNHIHNNWEETFTIMCKDIEQLDFDIALLGCGGYGLPLCNFIKEKLHKSAIYIGGGLQLMFGVMGRRWENREDWKQIIKDNGCTFIKPSESECIPNSHKVENSCYW